MCTAGEEEDRTDMAGAAREVEGLALQAVAAVDPAQAEDVWLMALERLTALGSRSQRLIKALVRHLTGQRQGPIRVSLVALDIQNCSSCLFHGPAWVNLVAYE